MTDQRPSGTTAGSTGQHGRPRACPAPLGAFDAHHPPDAALLGDCVHCGFCLPTCPTYVLWGEEMDSPRGRIYLMKDGLEGEPLGDADRAHFDACLGCMACVTACPSGVQYDRLIEATRAQVERSYERRRGDGRCARLIFALFPHPRGCGCCAAAARLPAHRPAGAAPHRLLAARAAARGDGAPRAAARPGASRLPAARPGRRARGARRRAAPGCVQRVFFADVNAATARVLRPRAATWWCPRPGVLRRALGARRPRGRGAALRPAAHRHLRGRGRRAHRRQRRRLRLDDEGVRRPARRRPGVRRARARRSPRRCATSPRSWPSSARSRPRHPLPLRSRTTTPATSRTPRASATSRALLARHPRAGAPRDRRGGAVLRLRRHLQHPRARAGARARRRKAANIVATGAEVLVAANPGCLMQIARDPAPGDPIGMAHTVEVLDASIRGAPLAALLAAERPRPLTTGVTRCSNRS